MKCVSYRQGARDVNIDRATVITHCKDLRTSKALHLVDHTRSAGGNLRGSMNPYEDRIVLHVVAPAHFLRFIIGSSEGESSKRQLFHLQR